MFVGDAPFEYAVNQKDIVPVVLPATSAREDCYDSGANANIENMRYRMSRFFRCVLSIGQFDGTKVRGSGLRGRRTATGAVDNVASARNADASGSVSDCSRVSPHEV